METNYGWSGFWIDTDVVGTDKGKATVSVPKHNDNLKRAANATPENPSGINWLGYVPYSGPKERQERVNKEILPNPLLKPCGYIEVKSQWISSNEKLPVYFEKVLLRYKGFLTTSFLSKEPSRMKDCWSVESYDSQYGNYIEVKDTHWVPYPVEPTVIKDNPEKDTVVEDYTCDPGDCGCPECK